MDYIGVFEDLQRALAFEGETITKGLIDLGELKRRFADLLTAAQAALAPIDLSDTPGRPARIIDHFFEEERRETFVRLFKDLQTAYEILSPDPFLRDYLDDYALIVQVYQAVYNYFNPEAERRRIQRDLLQKTDALIRRHVAVVALVDMLPLYPIHRDIANVINADAVSERVKITNLYRSLTVYIEQHQQEQPYLLSIGEQVEGVIQRLRERQISVQTALEQMTTLTENAIAASEEQAQSDLDGSEFALYWVLKGQGLAAPKETARQVHAVLDAHPGWAYNPKVESTVRLQLYKALSPQVRWQARQNVLGEEPAPMLAQARRAATLKTTVDALLRMNKVVAG